MDVKQVIVIRKDLKMRRGKEIAQGAHASNAWLARRVAKAAQVTKSTKSIWTDSLTLSPEELAWLNGGHTKVTVQVSSEWELIALYNHALKLGLNAELIIDSGKTEFAGVPTKTALAIGPDAAAEVDRVTGQLKLY